MQLSYRYDCGKPDIDVFLLGTDINVLSQLLLLFAVKAGFQAMEF